MWYFELIDAKKFEDILEKGISNDLQPASMYERATEVDDAKVVCQCRDVVSAGVGISLRWHMGKYVCPTTDTRPSRKRTQC